jgi:hypothetical protein
MGVGLPESSTWAYVLNNYLSGDKFFNLGTGGASCQQIVQDIYKYINLFGKPKAIFILFPNLERFNRIMYFNDKGSVFLETEHFNLFPPTDLKGKIKEFNNYETQFFNFYNMMTAFELYCKEAGITLHWATWDEKLNITCSGFSKYFNNYLDLNLNKVIKTRTKINELFSKKYSRLARDTEHFGTITQDWIFESFKKRVQNEI